MKEDHGRGRSEPYGRAARSTTCRMRPLLNKQHSSVFRQTPRHDAIGLFGVSLFVLSRLLQYLPDRSRDIAPSQPRAFLRSMVVCRSLIMNFYLSSILRGPRPAKERTKRNRGTMIFLVPLMFSRVEDLFSFQKPVSILTVVFDIV